MIRTGDLTCRLRQNDADMMDAMIGAIRHHGKKESKAVYNRVYDPIVYASNLLVQEYRAGQEIRVSESSTNAEIVLHGLTMITEEGIPDGNEKSGKIKTMTAMCYAFLERLAHTGNDLIYKKTIGGRFHRKFYNIMLPVTIDNMVFCLGASRFLEERIAQEVLNGVDQWEREYLFEWIKTNVPYLTITTWN